MVAYTGSPLKFL